MHFDLPALKPLYKIDGLKIRGAGRRPEERVERTHRSWTNVIKQKFARMKKKSYLEASKAFLKTFYSLSSSAFGDFPLIHVFIC